MNTWYPSRYGADDEAGALNDADPAAYAAGEPGPGTALAEWLVAHQVALTGAQHPPRRRRGGEPAPRRPRGATGVWVAPLAVA